MGMGEKSRCSHSRQKCIRCASLRVLSSMILTMEESKFCASMGCIYCLQPEGRRSNLLVSLYDW